MSQLDRLQKLLNDAKVTDDMIRGGVRLSDSGLHKVAGRLGISADEVKTLIATLVGRVRDQYERDLGLDEDEGGDLRFSFESDFLGNLTIRDGRSGDDHYLGGSKAAHVIQQLRSCKDSSQKEQDILRRACEENAIISEDEEDTAVGGDFEAELKNDAGSFNFPWKVGRQHGTATVAYRATNKKFDIELIDVRDGRGEEIDADQMKTEIVKQAQNFIGNE